MYSGLCILGIIYKESRYRGKIQVIATVLREPHDASYRRNIQSFTEEHATVLKCISAGHKRRKGRIDIFIRENSE